MVDDRENGWTKGPWTDGRTVPIRGDAVQIAFLCAAEPDSPQDIEARANLCLIGAATDLFEAAELALSMLGERGGIHTPTGRARSKLRAALAKAKAV